MAEKTAKKINDNKIMKNNDEITKKDEAIDIAPMPDYSGFQSGFDSAIALVDDIVLKNYISNLHGLDIVPLDSKEIENNYTQKVRLFRITEMVYEKDEFAFHKFASVFNTLSSSECSVFLIIDSDGEKTDFYMGIRAVDPELDAPFLIETLHNALKGQFPGIKTTEEIEAEDIEKLIERKSDTDNISVVSCVANTKDEDIKDNASFVQGLEKLAVAMQGNVYTAVILANSANQFALDSIRKSYEEIYTNLSPFSKYQVSYSTNYSINTGYAENRTHTHGTSISDSHGITLTDSHSHSASDSHSDSESKSKSKSRKTIVSQLATAAAVVSGAVGAALAVPTGGASLVVGGIASAGFGMLSGNTKTKTKTKTKTDTHTETDTDTHSKGVTDTHSEGENDADSFGINENWGKTNGSGQNITLNVENKTITDILERLNVQLERLHEFESLGMWECAAYFISDTPHIAEIAASTYKSIMRGKNSGVEVGAVNSWRHYEKDDVKQLTKYVTNFIHPVFSYRASAEKISVTPCSLVSGNELAIHMGLPRKSVCGFPVIEHADFGKEVVNYDHTSTEKYINLGNIFNMGSESVKNSVKLGVDSLSMHTFITGSTGSGKSNTVYELLSQLDSKNIRFLVVEPAKGEYKNIFGNSIINKTEVFGTNPNYTSLLRINPFAFPEGIHVLEHIDRLVEIFNVCWPMYAAMPAVLKEALLQSYEVCGWDLSRSENRYESSYKERIFPTFKDLLSELSEVIEKSAYDREVKSNYKGSLETRVKSLTNGLNGKIFCSDEIDNKVLFDSNVIVDLSRVGSLETKSLIMGVLIMKLGEYRMTHSKDMNIPLKHVTVLEEAHNILKRTSTEQNSESSNVAGKSVEMISNAIAEMRTYGEGFIIADQSPTSVDISAIKNTNTKIIMRLPELEDRHLAGKSAALKDEQLDEIAKLPKGVAVVYQNDWIEPVLCKIRKYKGKESLYFNPEKETDTRPETFIFRYEFLKLLLKDMVNEKTNVDIEAIETNVRFAGLSSKNRILVYSLLSEYKKTDSLTIWKQSNFEGLSKTVSELIGSQNLVRQYVFDASDYSELCLKLSELIDTFVDKTIDDDLRISVSQCLMKTYSCESDSNAEIYAAWRKYVCEKGSLS